MKRVGSTEIHIHYSTEEGQNLARGNELIWKEMTEKIAKSWKLKRK